MSDSLSPLGLAAITYGCYFGWPIVPLGRDKKPLIKGGFHMASQHPETISEWWDRWPDANIGFSPGSKGWIVFDIDTRQGEDVARELGLLEEATLECITSKGRHLYFELPKGLTIGNVSRWDKQGINVRSAKGYVVLPPSVHESGHVYTWRGELE